MDENLRKFCLLFMLIEFLLEKMNTCHNNPKNSSKAEINKHTFCGYSLLTHTVHLMLQVKLDCYRSKYCMEKFCEHATKIVTYEKKRK